MSIKCDVLVVGGGPAGCSAARAASLNGAKTILIEKKEEIGKNVKCAEGIGEFLFQYLPFTIPKEQLIWKMDGIFFWSDGLSIENCGDYWNSYSVDRRKFDGWLADLAVKNNVKLLLDTELIDIEFDQGKNITKAEVKQKQKIVEIIPKVVVAADGAESTVLKRMNLYNPKKGDIAEVYSWEMKNIDLFKPRFEQVFTGEFTPSGYAYIFPKSKNVANVGVGGIYPERKLRQYFEEFMEIPHVKKQVKNSEYVIEKSKKAPFNDITEKWAYGNVLLAGDVANQNLKPFIEGILPSVICGDVAGKLAYSYTRNKEITDEMYRSAVRKAMGNHFGVSNELQRGIMYLFAKKEKVKYLQFYGLITELLSPEDLEKTDKMDYVTLKSELMRRINEL